MAKTNQRRLAKELFMKGETQKRIAELVGVQEKTVGTWVAKYGWRQERDARMGSTHNKIQNIKDIIETLSEDRLRVQREMQKAKDKKNLDKLEKLQKEAAQIDDGVSKWNKALESLDKNNRISLSIYLEVMDRIFKAMQKYNTKLFLTTVEFQEQHLTDISSQY